MLLTGGVFSAMFGMAAVWGAQEGLGVREISIFVGALYVGGLVLQYPIGWVSDRMDRRTLIMGLSAVAALVMLVAALAPLPFTALIVVALLLGGITNPVYALLIAYTNDFLSREEMAAASAGLIFLNGFGAIFGPTATGWMMETVGPSGLFPVHRGPLHRADGLCPVPHDPPCRTAGDRCVPGRHAHRLAAGSRGRAGRGGQALTSAVAGRAIPCKA
jgi:MFS family permease